MEARLRVAVAGVSHWHADRHIQALHDAGATIVAVSDRQLPVAERHALDLHCPAYADFREAIGEGRPDFALAMGQPGEAGEVARHLLENGLPFAAEKPLGVTAADVAPLAELERERSVFAAVALVTRYSPIWSQMEELRQRDQLGPLCHAHFRLINGPPDRYTRDGVGWMLDPKIAGGGPMVNLGIHCVDAFLHLVSEPVEVVAAEASYRTYNSPIEDYCCAVLRSQSGVIGTIEAGYTFPSMAAGGRSSGDQEWRVAARDAFLCEDSASLRVVVANGQDCVWPSPPSSQHYTRFSADTIDRLRHGQAPVATIADCYRALKVIDAVYERAGARREYAPRAAQPAGDSAMSRVCGARSIAPLRQFDPQAGSVRA